MANYDAPATLYDSGLFYDSPAQPQPRRKIMAQINLGLSRLSVADLLQAANNIKTAMTANANFTTPNPTLTAIGTLITALTTANNTYESGQLTQKTNLTNRDDAAAALIAGLNSLAGYVQSQSGGDAAKIQSAGMGVKGAHSNGHSKPGVESVHHGGRQRGGTGFAVGSGSRREVLRDSNQPRAGDGDKLGHPAVGD